jgi:hypothetical protein
MRRKRSKKYGTIQGTVDTLGVGGLFIKENQNSENEEK